MRKLPDVIRGTKVKHLVQIECPGFNMDDDDFSCVTTCGDVTVVTEKSDMAIDDDGFYFVLDTVDFPCSTVYLTVVAQVPDPDFPGGFRTEKARKQLFNVIE